LRCGFGPAQLIKVVRESLMQRPADTKFDRPSTLRHCL
jgi:hypothetical protein